jgi:hypothetical protein
MFCSNCFDAAPWHGNAALREKPHAHRYTAEMRYLVIKDESRHARYVSNGIRDACHTVTWVRNGVNRFHLATNQALGRCHSRSHETLHS